MIGGDILNNGSDSKVYVRCVKGPPMPARIQPFIPENAFYSLRDECQRARNHTELSEIILRYSRQYNLEGSLAIHAEIPEDRNFTNSVIQFFGLLPDRVLIFDLARLQQGASPGPYQTTGIQYAQASLADTPVVQVNAVPTYTSTNNNVYPQQTATVEAQPVYMTSHTDTSPYR